MTFASTRIAAAIVMTIAASGAHALQLISMTLGDTIDASTGSLGVDGKSGASRFGGIDPATYFGASLFSGDVNGGAINVTQSNPAGSFSAGFPFTGGYFLPLTTGAIEMDIAGGVLAVNSLPWGGSFNGGVIDLSPDAGTLQVHNLIQTGANTYAYRIGWSHTFTCGDAGDPSACYLGYTSHWMLEGIMTTVPEPGSYAMLLVGLGLVGATARRRHNRPDWQRAIRRA